MRGFRLKVPKADQVAHLIAPQGQDMAQKTVGVPSDSSLQSPLCHNPPTSFSGGPLQFITFTQQRVHKEVLCRVIPEP